MDFGGFILFFLLAATCLVGGLFVAVAFMARVPGRRLALGLWLGGLVSLAILGRVLYQVYWLDERLFGAAARGDSEQVRSLLSSGASPDSTWEDGTSALAAARRAGHEDVVLLLKRAGASE